MVGSNSGVDVVPTPPQNTTTTTTKKKSKVEKNSVKNSTHSLI